jgi:hypothetical protein
VSFFFLAEVHCLQGRSEGSAVLNFRWYRATCPACLKPIDILPPDSIVAEYHGLAHRCPVCRRWLATYILIGSKRHPDVRLIETEIAPPGGEPLRRRTVG